MRIQISIILLLLFSAVSFAQTGSSYTLAEAQEYAVLNSYSAKTVQLDLESSKKRVKEITAIGLPQITGNLSYQNYIKIPTTVIPANTFDPSLPDDAVQEIEFGVPHNLTADITGRQLIFDGSYIVGLQAAKTYVQLAKDNQAKNDIDIKNQVANAYYMVLAAQRNEEIIKENIGKVTQIYEETMALFEVGFVEEQDADQLKLSKMSLQSSIDNATRQVTVAKNLLKFQMGLPIANDITLSDDIDNLMTESNKPEFLTSNFDVNNHIDFRMAETSLKASELTLKNEKWSYLPKLTGFFTHQQQSPTTEFNYFGDATFYPATFWGLNLEVPIFSSFMKHNKVQQAKIEVDKVIIQKTQVEEGLKMELQNARSNYAYAIDNFNLANENLALAESIHSKTATKYKEGISSSMELAQAQNQYLTTQGNYIQSLLTLLNSKTQLDKALNNY